MVLDKSESRTYEAFFCLAGNATTDGLMMAVCQASQGMVLAARRLSDLP